MLPQYLSFLRAHLSADAAVLVAVASLTWNMVTVWPTEVEVHNAFSARNHDLIHKLESFIIETAGRSLWAKMQETADRDQDYAQTLENWLRFGGGSTLTLRELAAPFGNYWRGLVHQNSVDYIDSARAKI